MDVNKFTEQDLEQLKNDLLPLAQEAEKLHAYFCSKTEDLGKVINILAFYMSGLRLDEEDMRHFMMLWKELHFLKVNLLRELDKS